MAFRSLAPIFLAVASLLGMSGAVSVLSPPENVRVVSEDLGLTLVWDPPNNPAGHNLTYTTELSVSGSLALGGFRPVCERKRRRSCDIIAMKTAEGISAYGSYLLRVRAELQELYSDWSTTTTPFRIHKMTNISAPSVRLFERSGDIKVQLTDPIMKINTFQEVYHPVTYVITYWRQGETHKKRLVSQKSHVILTAEQLFPQGNYCMEAHIRMTIYGSKSSANTPPTCFNNTHDGAVSALPPPVNVRVVSEDLGLTLVWDPPNNPAGHNLTYTTELGFSSISGFRPMCVGNRRQSCDIITETRSRITAFGSYLLRVRTELQELYSVWKTPPAEFTIDKMTSISAPSVRLFETSGDIEVQLTDPIMKINTFQDIYRPVTYVITYWRQGETHNPVKHEITYMRQVETYKFSQQTESPQSHVILPANQLSAPGNYCVEAHMLMPYYNKSSAHSQPTCINYSPEIPIMIGRYCLKIA